MDSISTKFPTFHNGKKIRGKAVAPAPKKDSTDNEDNFIIMEFKTKEDFKVENLQRIYKDVLKTLRLVVSLASQPYEFLGIQCSLLGQLRHTVSTAMKMTRGAWESTISEELWEFFCTQLIELHLTCLFN